MPGFVPIRPIPGRRAPRGLAAGGRAVPPPPRPVARKSFSAPGPETTAGSSAEFPSIWRIAKVSRHKSEFRRFPDADFVTDLVGGAMGTDLASVADRTGRAADGRVNSIADPSATGTCSTSGHSFRPPRGGLEPDPTWPPGPVGGTDVGLARSLSRRPGGARPSPGPRAVAIRLFSGGIVKRRVNFRRVNGGGGEPSGRRSFGHGRRSADARGLGSGHFGAAAWLSGDVHAASVCGAGADSSTHNASRIDKEIVTTALRRTWWRMDVPAPSVARGRGRVIRSDAAGLETRWIGEGAPRGRPLFRRPVRRIVG